MHCVHVSLTSTIVAAFWAHVSLVGIVFYIIFTLYIIVNNGAPSMIVHIMGPCPSNVAKGI